MNNVQAIDLAGLLKGLMPKITDDQVREVKAMLLQVDYVVAEKVIRRYATESADFSLAEFRRLLPRIEIGESPFQRTWRELRDMRKGFKSVLEYREHRDEQYAAIVRGLSDEAVAKLATDALASHTEIDGPFRDRLLKRGPEASGVLRGFVVEFMESHETASA